MKFYRILHRVGAEFGNTSARQVAIDFDLAPDWLAGEGAGDMSHPLPLPLYPVPTPLPFVGVLASLKYFFSQCFKFFLIFSRILLP